jgi:hypothetical protein
MFGVTEFQFTMKKKLQRQMVVMVAQDEFANATKVHI